MADLENDEYWRGKLTPREYSICREKGTEPPFSGQYWNCGERGAYRCKCCGAPLFHSDSKYDSGTGWPSFYRAAEDGALREASDTRYGMLRTEVMCDKCGAHLGHLFEDGPQPTGLRYCINSAALDLERAD